MNKLGVHALVWVGGWSEDECTRAIRSTAELGYDFIEIPLLDPYGFPVEFTRSRLEEHKLGATASLGLSAATDISSEDPEAVRRGEDLLNTAVSVVRDLGATHFCGVIHSALQKYMAPRTERGVANVVEVLRRVGERAQASNIKVGVEVVNRYETNIVNTAAEVVALLDRIGQPEPLRPPRHLPHEHRGRLRRRGDRALRRPDRLFPHRREPSRLSRHRHGRLHRRVPEPRPDRL